MKGQAKYGVGGRPILRLSMFLRKVRWQGLTFVLPVRNSRGPVEKESSRPWSRPSLGKREKRPVKREPQVQVKPKRGNRAKRAFMLVTVVLVGSFACVLLLLLMGVYFVKEILLFVACAALLAFLAANLTLLGILFHAAGRRVLQCFRKPGIAPQEEVGSQQHADPLVGSLTLGAAARIGPLRVRAGPASLVRGISRGAWEEKRGPIGLGSIRPRRGESMS